MRFFFFDFVFEGLGGSRSLTLWANGWEHRWQSCKNESHLHLKVVISTEPWTLTHTPNVRLSVISITSFQTALPTAQVLSYQSWLFCGLVKAPTSFVSFCLLSISEATNFNSTEPNLNRAVSVKSDTDVLRKRDCWSLGIINWTIQVIGTNRRMDFHDFSHKSSPNISGISNGGTYLYELSVRLM